jgi:hypothetical protein
METGRLAVNPKSAHAFCSAEASPVGTHIETGSVSRKGLMDSVNERAAVGAHVKEVYARFGLAVYWAQVLERGVVNALVIVDLIPSRRHLARSAEEWPGPGADGGR